MMVQRKTAAKYLDKIVESGLLVKVQMGRSNYYINKELMDLFVHQGDNEDINNDFPIESVHDKL
jgi:predicted transcriptional regulator